MKEYITQQHKRELLDIAVIHGDFVLASGLRSREKFDFDRIESGTEAFTVALNGLAACIRENVDEHDDEHDDDGSLALVTVATGANRLGDHLAHMLHMYHVPSRKDDEGDFYIPERTKGITGILVDDVYTTGSSFEKVQNEFRGRIIGAYTLLDRSGKVSPTLSNGVKVHSVIKSPL